MVEQAEGNRVLVITSSRRTGIMYPDRNGTYQCFDQTNTISQFAKFSVAVPSFDRIPELMRMALRECYNGRPGVVHIDIPENIINGSFKDPVNLWDRHQYRLHTNPEPSEAQLNEAVDLLLQAKFPIIHAGSGVIHAQAYDQLEKVADLMQMMVTTSWAGRGVMRESNDLNMPMVHIETNIKIRTEADVVLILGSRVGETDWWGKAPYWNADQKVIQVDIDPSTLGANKPVELAIQADIQKFLLVLFHKLVKQKDQLHLNQRKQKIEPFVQDKNRNRKKLDQKLEDLETPMNPALVAALANKVLPSDTPIVADGGNTTIWANFYSSIEKPGSLFSTFKFGMLGAGVAQALGVAVAGPNKPVVCITGDGAMGFHPQEVETAVRNKLKIIFIVVCDKQWGMVKMSQDFSLRPVKTIVKKSLDESENINSDLGEIQFDKLAESMGAIGARVNDPHEYKLALQAALQADQPTVIHADVDPVKHMWAPGLRYFKNMHAEPKGK
ncbi:thiamine pyrophosphate-binding protein [Halalkalibacillus halophilus]|uniref:thiamine pyrophosphate-binding protein n=1 Tax=Halalkalibacillus halophilus TaxID=392827 RepID=UPI0024814664|nr:thiamine pyrophosphate-binding protein [Halalkalibacillus halophilus]